MVNAVDHSVIDETVKNNIKPTDIESVSVVVEKPKPFDWRLAPWQDYPQDDDVPAPKPDDESKGLESFKNTIGIIGFRYDSYKGLERI